MAERDPVRGDEEGAVGFAAPVSGFFDRGDRRTHLEQLRHLSQWSRRVLLVTGPRGVGKSALFRQLSATLEPRAKAARINGSLVSGTREVLNAVVQGFGLAVPADADTQTLRQLIGEHAAEQARADRFCVTLIDDAEVLEPKALEHLIELASGSPLRVVLFGEIRLVPAVERLAEPRGVGWHEIRLSGFGAEDVRAYLHWRLAQQGYADDLPFTDAQVKEIARLSEGLPGRIDQMANVLLARIQSAGQGPEGRREFPALHKALLAVLVVVIAFLYLLWPAGDQDTPSLSRAEPLALPRQSTPPPALDAPALDAPASDAPASDVPSPAVPAAAGGAEPEADAAAEPEPRDVAAATPPAPQAAEPAPSAEPTPPAEPSTEPTAEPPSTPAATASTVATDSPAATSPAPGGARGPAWILGQPASAYTLQLVSFSTAERAAAYLAAQDRPDAFAGYRLQRDGRTLHVVVYGSFEDRAAAEQAATRLPASVGDVKPWIRTFGQVQEAVRTAQ